MRIRNAGWRIRAAAAVMALVFLPGIAIGQAGGGCTPPSFVEKDVSYAVYDSSATQVGTLVGTWKRWWPHGQTVYCQLQPADRWTQVQFWGTLQITGLNSRVVTVGEKSTDDPENYWTYWDNEDGFRSRIQFWCGFSGWEVTDLYADPSQVVGNYQEALSETGPVVSYTIVPSGAQNPSAPLSPETIGCPCLDPDVDCPFVLESCTEDELVDNTQGTNAPPIGCAVVRLWDRRKESGEICVSCGVMYEACYILYGMSEPCNVRVCTTRGQYGTGALVNWTTRSYEDVPYCGEPLPSTRYRFWQDGDDEEVHLDIMVTLGFCTDTESYLNPRCGGTGPSIPRHPDIDNKIGSGSSCVAQMTACAACD